LFELGRSIPAISAGTRAAAGRYDDDADVARHTRHTH
jgi:hypothetical protein